MRIALIIIAALLATTSAQRFNRRFGSGRAFRQGRQQDVTAPISSYGVDIGNENGNENNNDLPVSLAGSVGNSNGFSTGNGEENRFLTEKNVPGVPGEDYPIHSSMPETTFSCDGQLDGGYYADPEAQCQVFHICTDDGFGGLAKYSFLCPNGTVFNQEYFICDWWFNFDCAQAEALYGRNDEIRAEQEDNTDNSSLNNGENTFNNGDNTFSAPEAYGAPEVRSGRRRNFGRQGRRF